MADATSGRWRFIVAVTDLIEKYYSSFHHLLNYYGFRVIGKLTQGKMSSCCYVMQTGTSSVLSDLLAKWDCCWRNEDNKEKEIVRYNGVAGADNNVDRYTPTAFSPSVAWRDGMMLSKGGEGGCNEDDKDEAIVGHDGNNGADFDGTRGQSAIATGMRHRSIIDVDSVGEAIIGE